MSGPLVSVVVPAYNHARFLPEAVDSVLAQTHAPVEVVVIDDGSTDDTPAVLARYGARIRTERRANAGQSAALNRGWELSRGAVLSYLSADDRLAPDAAEAAVEAFAQAPGLALVYGDFEILDAASRVVRRVEAPDYSYEDMLVRSRCLPGPGVFLRREAFAAAGGWNTALRQMPDFEYWLRLGLVGPFRRIPRALAAFRVHAGSQTFAPPDDARAQEVVRIVGAILERADLPEELRGRRAAALANAHVVEAQLRIQSGRTGLAAASLKRALALQPSAVFSALTARRIASAIAARRRRGAAA